jgi:hypothetical protein
MENTLKTLGITLEESKRQLTPTERKKELEQNICAYTNEVLEDKPVSILYHYYPDKQKQKLFSDPSLKEVFLVENQFDIQERDGLPKQGFINLTQILLENPGKVTFWYSPAGPASFDNNSQNPFNKINYDYGQLYFQYFDGEKINAIALKITNLEVLDYFSSQIRKILDQDDDPKNKIKNSLLNPILTNLNIDDFFNQDFTSEILFYKHYHLVEVINTIKDVLLGKTKKNTIFSIPENYLYQTTQETILQTYLGVIQQHLKINNWSQINLSGSCGGTIITIDQIEALFETPRSELFSQVDKLMSIFSSTFRKLAQTEEKWEYHEGACVVCKANPTKVGPCGVCKECEKKFS